MNVILYIPTDVHKEDSHLQLVTALQQQLGDMIEVTHTASFKGAHPSLIHVFGCWNYAAAMMLFKANKAGIPTVYSPLGGLQPWILDKHKGDKEMKMLAYQKRMTSLASALHATNKLEYDNLVKLKWNKRLQMIENSAITNDISEEEMASKMLSLYQKVLDSNTYTLIDKETFRIIGNLLQAGVDKDSYRNKEVKADLLNRLQQLKEEDWRNIFLYASEEQIIDKIKNALNRLQFHAPSINLETIKRFPTSDHYISEKITIDPNDLEHSLCKAFETLYKEMKHKTAPLCHLSDLYELLRFTSYDEDKFAELINKSGMQNFASRVIAVLEECIGLTEGFMPISPLYDKETDKIKRDITKIRKL
ncbi:MAG: hypothetical protein LKG25_04100 [Prevotella sp.]|jgi:hypothetical protein|nr:hypothetical protein [Prevotella sp.]MCI1281757.1 hypothetical protein [Prevotella sp.]